MNLKSIILISFVFLFSNLASAQFGGFGGKKGKTIKGTIKGALVDSISNQPVAYATLSLHKAGKDKIIDGILSEDDGKFKFSEVVNGKYDIRISFLGYEDKLLKDVEVTLKKPTTDIDQITMATSSVMLDEVQVTEKRSLIESKVDKIVFNAEDDTSTSGGDASDVLRKVPMLSVDLDGNVSLRGSQNITILINGKPSGMFSTNTADALKMFPADQIKKVEVITQPGAKYDGEGSGGIINIITKGKDIEGIAGSVNVSAGTRQNSANSSLNIGKGRFGFTANGGVYYSVPNDANLSFARFLSTGENIYSYGGITNTERLGFSGSASAFYDINAYNALNTSFTYRGFGFDQFSDANGAFGPISFHRDNNGNNLFAGYDWNTDFTKKYESNDKKELVFAVQISGNDQNQENRVVETIMAGPGVDRNEDIFNYGDNVEITGQVDFVQPIGAAKLEVGAKTVVRNIDSDSQFFVDNDSGGPKVLDANRSNIFLYDQNVYAGYGSYNFYLKKLNIVTGLRYERTSIGGDGEAGGSTFENTYDNFLPNIAISKSLKNFKNIKLSYSKRIQRPSLRYINPFRNTADFGNISFGNPVLRPELTDQFELGYNTNILGATIFSTLYYKITTEIIESIVQIDNNISTTTFSNVGENKSIGLNLFASKSVGRFTLRLGGDIGSYNVTGIVGTKELNNKALNYKIFTSGELSISGNLKADFFGIFNSPRYTLQGQNPSFSMLGIGFRKDFKNKMSVGIRIIEPFEEFKSFDTKIEGDGFTQESKFQLPFRSFGVSFSYKFGKVDFRERKSKIKNTDQKQDEGGQGGGGQQSGQRGN